MKFVKYELEFDQLPPLTEQQKAEIAALKSAPDDEIDYSDIPPLTDEFWKNAVHNPFHRPTKLEIGRRIAPTRLLWRGAPQDA